MNFIRLPGNVFASREKLKHKFAEYILSFFGFIKNSSLMSLWIFALRFLISAGRENGFDKSKIW